MATSSSKIVKLSEKLAKSVLAPSKRDSYLPTLLPLNAIKTSPVFQNPQKWVSRFRQIAESERIQSYRQLEYSSIAQVLSSPPRMTHATRTVVPRDLLLPFRVMENPFIANDENNISDKHADFEYIIAPFHPDEKKIPEDPVTYYPRDVTLLEEYPDSYEQEISTLKKYSLNVNFYPNITDWKRVGWNVNTPAVVKKISTDRIEKLLKAIPTINDEDERSAKIRLSYEPNMYETLDFKNDCILINTAKVASDNDDLRLLFEKKFPSNFIPINESNISLIKELVVYCIFIG